MKFRTKIRYLIIAREGKPIGILNVSAVAPHYPFSRRKFFQKRSFEERKFDWTKKKKKKNRVCGEFDASASRSLTCDVSFVGCTSITAP